MSVWENQQQAVNCFSKIFVEYLELKKKTETGNGIE